MKFDLEATNGFLILGLCNLGVSMVHKYIWLCLAPASGQTLSSVGEHEALKRAALSACEALEVEGVQSGSSLGSHLIALSNQMRERF